MVPPEFLSMMISLDGKEIYPGNLGAGELSHSGVADLLHALDRDEYRELRWSSDDAGESLVVRTHPDDQYDEAWLKACILTRFPTREKAANWGLRNLPMGIRRLFLGRTTIKSLPKGFFFGGDLNVGGSLINKLPEGLRVGRSLIGLAQTDITELPPGLHINHCLSLTGTKISSLPEGLFVGDLLSLKDSLITELPRGLQVGGNLNLRGTKITTLPDDLSVGGWICVGDAAIKKIPPGIRPEQVKV